MSNDFKQMYETKCLEFDQLNEQFNQYQVQSDEFINQLEKQNQQLKRKNDALARQLNQIKEKRKQYQNTVERQIETTRKEREEFRNKFVQFERKVIELENTNESLQSDLRATKADLYEYQQRTQKTMEELALLQIQMEEDTQSNQEQIARLRGQLKQTEDELYAMHHGKQTRDEQNRNQSNSKNKDDSFHSGKERTDRRSSVADSKIKKKKNKFGQTLQDIRSFLKEIQNRREQLDSKFNDLLQ